MNDWRREQAISIKKYLVKIKNFSLRLLPLASLREKITLISSPHIVLHPVPPGLIQSFHLSCIQVSIYLIQSH